MHALIYVLVEVNGDKNVLYSGFPFKEPPIPYIIWIALLFKT